MIGKVYKHSYLKSVSVMLLSYRGLFVFALISIIAIEKSMFREIDKPNQLRVIETVMSFQIKGL